jgi:hypothetical protein
MPAEVAFSPVGAVHGVFTKGLFVQYSNSIEPIFEGVNVVNLNVCDVTADGKLSPILTERAVKSSALTRDVRAKIHDIKINTKAVDKRLSV